MKVFKSFVQGLVLSSSIFLVTVTAAAATPEVSDTWIQTKLITTYVLNRHLNVFDIDTDVRDQVVYLKGTVETPIEKDLAEQIARSVNGVKSVQNNIVVDAEKGAIARRSPRSSDDRTFGQTITDMTTTASIKSKFLVNQNVHGLEINVDTKSGVVTLRGKVPSSAEKELAAKIAENTEGVERVNNNLTIG
ncbi:MAG: BON domain-containing protein [Oligoflexia bacterium]|nr:BON domain-containing protein [Oligoflexia bacterium]